MDKVALLERRLERERAARKQAESILESKAIELFRANEALQGLNQGLEEEVQRRSKDLAQSEVKYRNLVEQATDIVFNVDQDGYFTYMNTIGFARFGYTEEEVIGSRYLDYISDTHKQEVFDYYTRLLTEEITSDYYEFPVLDKSGQLFWIGQNVNRSKANDGKVYFSAVARDITQRKRTEEALAQAKKALVKSEVKYRSIMENMNLGLLEVDNRGIIIRSYDHFNEMTGYTHGELEGLPALNTLIAPGYEDIILAQNSDRQKGETGVYEVKMKKKDGQEIWVLISGAPFYNENEEVVGSIGIHYDITARKHLEDALHLAREKAVKAQEAEKRFLANMSHEIRTPLNAVIGMTHLMKDTTLNEEQSEYMGMLSSSAEVLLNLISDVLDISKIDSGAFEVNAAPFVLQDEIRNIIKTFKISSAQKDVPLMSNVDPRIDTEVIGDKQLISQVLINLIGNAVKFTSEGQIDLDITIITENLQNYHLRFEVKDTGIGMTSYQLDVVFKEFKQASGEIRTKYGGTGLGLAISHKIIDHLGGVLTAESTPHKGSTFSFELVLPRGGQIESASVPVVETSIFEEEHSFKVLVVDDHPLNLKYATKLLSKWSIIYDTASDGLEALDLIRASDFDLVLMDLQMPVMDGLEATRRVRALDGKKGELPIIALSASTFLSKRQMAEEAGVSDFLSKPFAPRQLQEVLQKHLSIRGNSNDALESFQYDERLDVSYLLEAYQEDHNYAYEMFVTFLEMIEPELTSLDTHATLDTTAAKKVLHKIKPTFAMVGLSSITEEVERLERAWDSLEMSAIKDRISRLVSICKQQIPIVRSECDRLGQFVKSQI